MAQGLERGGPAFGVRPQVWRKGPSEFVTGTLTLVVGPSGAGKDTLIRGARQALAGEWRFVFARREITRPAAAGGEAHLPVSEAEFTARQAQGGYALSWRAHGLGYGIPAGIGDALASGRTVVINASRTVIGPARWRYGDVAVVHVTAPDPVLRHRLEARGREADEDIAARVERAAALDVAGPGVVTLVNDLPLDQAIASFVRILRGLRVAA